MTQALLPMASSVCSLRLCLLRLCSLRPTQDHCDSTPGAGVRPARCAAPVGLAPLRQPPLPAGGCLLTALLLTHYSLLTTHYPLLTTHYSLPNTHYPTPNTRHPTPTPTIPTLYLLPPTIPTAPPVGGGLRLPSLCGGDDGHLHARRTFTLLPLPTDH